MSFDPRDFIERANWTFSTTTADKPNWKHWYIVEDHYRDDLRLPPLSLT